LGENHPELATAYINIGITYQDKCEYDKSLQYFESALKIDKTFGQNHPELAFAYFKLA
jgi:tetratricopeptide (TPR) repeat protein